MERVDERRERGPANGKPKKATSRMPFHKSRAMDDLDVAGEYEPSTSQTSPQNHTGITLVLPSLRAIKAANAGKKTKGKNANGLGHGSEVERRPKIPRPVKLKPLKEVLTKLMSQIKKKDDYAFFLNPVDPALVPGYTDVIKDPMDFGTMTVKVSRGKYRSLEDFTNDFRLVITNAKIFNPPGSIYHVEAERIETWGLEHITRSSAHVIEYETDWNIDVEQDEDPSASQHVNIDDEVSTPRDIDGSMAAASRATSMTPAPGQAQGAATGKRGPRGPYKKHAQSMLSEGLDTEGRMPGAKDGVGAFPPGSDWAELMIALKIKGKRYKTKKERLRFEKEGPPYHPDGSLNYFEMEDPFSFLNAFVPDPPTRPQVTPLYPPPTIPASHMPQPSTIDPTQPQPYPHPPYPPIPPPTPITIPPDRPFPALSTISTIQTQPQIPASTSTSTSTYAPTRPPQKRNHWTIVRNAPARSRLKDKDGDGGGAEDGKPMWKVPRNVGPADYGSFAAFLGELAATAVGMGTSTSTSTSTGTGMAGTTTNAAAEYLYGSEHRLFATIRSTVAHRGMKRKREAEEGEDEANANKDVGDDSALQSWTDEDAVDGWHYLRDVVYGGVDGYAYVRSLAEFVGPSVYLERESDEVGGDEGEQEHEYGHVNDDGNYDHEQEQEQEQEQKPIVTPSSTPVHPLGVPLARYIEDNLVDPITQGRHGFLRDMLLPLVFSHTVGGSEGGSQSQSQPLSLSLSLFDVCKAAMGARAMNAALLDMAALIRTPEEFARESVIEGWGVGASEHGGGEGEGGSTGTNGNEETRAQAWTQVEAGGEEEREAIGRALEWSVGVIEELSERAEVRVADKDDGGEEVKVKREVIEEEEDAMDVDVDVDPKPGPGPDFSPPSQGQEHKPDAGEEDALVKRLRMNLLALAKRAPVNRIAKLPIELVPESIRGIVPIV